MTLAPIEVALIDDELHSRQTLRKLLDDFCPLVKIIGEANGVISGYRLLKEISPDAVFLDVQMTDGTGFDLLKKFHSPPFQVIFTTAFDKFAIKAFRFNAIDYLLKPVDINELLQAVDKIIPSQMTFEPDKRLPLLLEANDSGRLEILALSSNEGLQFVKLKEIVRMESESNYTTFFLESGNKITVSKTLKNFEQLLQDDDFFRPHQSHLVNLLYMKKILKEDGGYILMKDQNKIPVARSRKEELLRLIKERFLQ